MDSLCTICKQINFEALRNPLMSDLPALKESRVDTGRHPFKPKRDDAHISTALGSFREILQRAPSCRLCHLIGDAISNAGLQQPDELKVKEDEPCRAETSFYGVYNDPSGNNYFVRRLSILVADDTYNPGGPRRSLYFAFQACDVGASSIQVNEHFADPRPGVDIMVFGGRRRPLQLDMQWVRRWIDICEKDHGKKCEEADVEPHGDRLPLIRFVDVKKKCVVTLKDVHVPDCRYIALSYVWGGPQEFKLVALNQNRLAKPGSLVDGENGKLPRTIKDAIVLTDSLGVDYLWIDALCILQDNEADKGVQIAAMAQIYGFSFITVVAASSPSVYGGLPGLHLGTRVEEQHEAVVIPPADQRDKGGTATAGLSLMTTLQPLVRDSDHYCERTPWNTRGWTMQERALSRRVLVFTREQVYWACREASFCEESYFENSVLPFHRFHENGLELTLRRHYRNFYEPPDDELRYWKTYQKLVATYTRRTFSYRGDVFDAFRAVLQGLSDLGKGETFTWGLPRSHFEQSLLWSSFRGQQRSKALSTLPMTSLQVRVPFPSWSWMGWIGETFICVGDDRFDEYMGEIPEILCFEHNHSPLRVERVRKSSMAYERTTRALPTWKRFQDQPVTLDDLAREHPRLIETELKTVPETQVIFFWTSSAFFTVVVESDAMATCQTKIKSSDGSIAGSMEATTTTPESEYKCEFIVLASRRNQFTEPVLLVLLIEWGNDGNAYRINNAEISEEAWLREPHAWKLIPLR